MSKLRNQVPQEQGITPIKDLHILAFGGTFNARQDRNSDTLIVGDTPMGEKLIKEYVKPEYASQIDSKLVAQRHSYEASDNDIRYLVESIITPVKKIYL